MRKLSSLEPLYNIYSPAHRKQERPEVRWDFLVYVARNLAAAFDAMHCKGVVLGDVNHGNAVVAKDSRVTLIDCDSFQLNQQHLCEVGVAHFTPPELQGIARFDAVTRSVNHDNFGLAVLVFHLLFAGRHPYSGVPLTRSELPLEKAISEFRFAYSHSARARGVCPPPFSVPLGVVPDSVGAMFEQAFTENGPRSRPTAVQWFEALDHLAKSLKLCARSRAHLFASHEQQCPWCRLDAQGAVLFVDVAAFVPGAGLQAPIGTAFSLAQVWAAIEAVAPPEHWMLPHPGQFKEIGTPVPTDITNAGVKVWVAKVLTAVVGIGVTLAVPAAWFLALAGVLYLLFGDTKRALRVERRRRVQAADDARRHYEQLRSQAEASVSIEPYRAKLDQLRKARDAHQRLRVEEDEELRRLRNDAEKRQLHQFLDRHFIQAASIAGIGPTRKAQLASFGIETAADIDYHRVQGVQGIGPQLASNLVDWRRRIEKLFRFDSANAVSAADLQLLRSRMARRQRDLETELSGGVEALRRVVHDIRTRRTIAETPVRTAAQAAAKARADLDAMEQV